MATDAASEGLNLQRLSPLINIDLPWNPARLEQRRGRIDRIGQMAGSIEVLNLRYRGSVEDDVHRALSGRLQAIRDVFGTVPDTLEDVWVLTALGQAEDAKRRIERSPRSTPPSCATRTTCPRQPGSAAPRCGTSTTWPALSSAGGETEGHHNRAGRACPHRRGQPHHVR